ncbi:hypothetical protein [Streptomyces glomeratus]|uniref:Uncharacterized protein n=1 Tax=Streptomyces glomeratus TaxID=284452 RepID=A0ABP6M183_9ACTN|nr:hypothetical protein [Streptomyces glomeratus]MCF1512157.1 hypothetical protein [Streptomyces glomeratus]
MASFLTALAASIAGGATGAFGGTFGALQLAKRTDRRTVTDQLVAEFFSADFLKHRIAVHELRTAVDSQAVSVASVAGGFWDPGRPDYYTGPPVEPGELNQHQHLEAYIGYIVRLARALEGRRLDQDSARAALGMHLSWHDRIVQRVASVTAQQAREHPSVVPDWTLKAELVHLKLVPDR